MALAYAVTVPSSMYRNPTVPTGAVDTEHTQTELGMAREPRVILQSYTD